MSKKTVETIIDSGNDYVIQVKANQPTLLHAIQEIVERGEPVSRHTREERSRGRLERRVTTVFVPPDILLTSWKGLHRIIHVESNVVHDEKETHSHRYSISSIDSDDAELFARGVRGHWTIENRLHWVKDVIQHEDDSGIKKGNGVETLSVLKNVAITICRELGFDSIKGAAIHFASNVKELLLYFRT